jgi:hypothetical protein
MLKFIKIIRFIKEHRKIGITEFKILTTCCEIIIVAKYKNKSNELKIKYR